MREDCVLESNASGELPSKLSPCSLVYAPNLRNGSCAHSGAQEISKKQRKHSNNGFDGRGVWPAICSFDAVLAVEGRRMAVEGRRMAVDKKNTASYPESRAHELIAGARFPLGLCKLPCNIPGRSPEGWDSPTPRSVRHVTSEVKVHGVLTFGYVVNDPSAGSPTETLLRLLLPLNDQV
jgi:hypothetical protein